MIEKYDLKEMLAEIASDEAMDKLNSGGEKDKADA